MKINSFLRVSAFIYIFTAALISCKSPHQVLIIEKTKMYHTEHCQHVNMAFARLMAREEAKRMNYKPCPDCKPDSDQ